MEIPYTVKPRPDTGLSNPKLGIWLFIASEVMLFGGLFAGYIFMRQGADPGYWPMGWLNVPVGTMNTFILILSSVTVILSWEALKMHKYRAFKNWLALTWICGLIFLGVKLAYEWPAKFHHFGAYVKEEAAEKYDKHLGNLGEKGTFARNKTPRYFIGGHVENMKQASVPYMTKERFDYFIERKATLERGRKESEDSYQKRLAEQQIKVDATRPKLLADMGVPQDKIPQLLNKDLPAEEAAKLRAEVLAELNVIKVVGLDAENADPFDPDNDKAHFIPRSQVHQHHPVVLHKEDLVPAHGALLPRLNTYLATYFMITGLHGLHVLGGVIVFFYFWVTAKKWYEHHHQQLCNRIEVSGLFWHLVDLIWIFVFPIFYLL